MVEIEPKNQSDKGNNEPWWRPGMALLFNVTGWIAGPVVIAVLIGKWLDEKYNTDPWILLSLVFIAFVFSMIGITKETMKAIAKIDKEKIIRKNK